MAVTIRPVTSSRDRKRFIDLPYRFYEDNPHWVPPLRRDVKHTLDPNKNAFFEHGTIQLFLAERADGSLAGRIAAIENGMHLKKYDDGNGFFGFFECEDNFETAQALLDAAAAWLAHRALTGMRGPANPSLNDTAGLLVDGFDQRPSILMPYNPPYYEDFFEEWGLERAMTMWAYYCHYKYVQVEKLKRGVEIIKKRYPNYSLRTIDMDRFDEEAETILDIYNRSWSENWGHVPMTEAEFKQLGENMKQIIEPELIFIIEDAGKPIAFSIAIPNLNLALRHIPNGRLFPTGLAKLLAYSKFGGIYECRVPLLGILPEYRRQGLFAPLMLETIQKAPPMGYESAEMSWVLDSNAALKNVLEPLGAVIDKEYAMFEGSVTRAPST